MSRPRLSVCIPSYNRVNVLPELLDSIFSQDFKDYEVVICEDQSREREEIRKVVEEYAERYPGVIRYFENEENLGYDGNFRRLIEKAQGDYCFFMGNDDLVCPGAFSTVAAALERHPNVGAILRSYASFDNNDPEQINQEFRYFESERFFPAGADSICTIYRRFVVICGLVLHRDTAHKYATDMWDGSTLYQLHLVANILTEMNAVSIPEIIALRRNGNVPEFGNSSRERGIFTPTKVTPSSSLHFMKCMVGIAQNAEKTQGVPIADRIALDISNYSYPIIGYHCDKPLPVFVRYVWGLIRMGLGRSPMFYAYFILLAVFGPRVGDRIIRFVKERLGYTPAIGRL